MRIENIFHNKRGQVTIFIIIAIVIIASASVYFFIREDKNIKDVTFDASDVKIFVDDCIDKSGEEVILQVANGGGYYLSSKNSLSSGIPIYSNEGEDKSPRLEEMEDEISYFVSESLFFCIKNFIDFPWYEIKQEQIDVNVKIQENDILMDVYYPITIKKDKSVVLFNKFEGFKFEYRLGSIYKFNEKLLKDYLSKGGICLNCVLEDSLYYDLYTSFFNEGNYSIIIVKDKTEGSELFFPFALEKQ